MANTKKISAFEKTIPVDFVPETVCELKSNLKAALFIQSDEADKGANHE